MPRTTRRLSAPILLDALEPRTLLSVAGSTLAGPQTPGAVYTFRELFNNQTVGTFTRTIVGPTTFNTHPVTEIDETDTPTGAASSFIQRYNAFDANLDYISYGSISGAATTINNPAAILFPTGIAAGTTSTNSYTAIASSSGGNTSTQVTDVITLVAQSNANPESTFTLVTPGGTFQVYEVDEARTFTNGSSTTINFRHFISPTFGEVEFTQAIGNSTPTVFQLTSLTGLGNITPSPVAAKLAFAQQPTTAAANATISPAITVDVEDAGGNLVTTDNSTIVLSIASGNGTLGGTVTAQALNGVATFANLTLPTAGTYTLKATDGALTAATSSSFTITPTAPLLPPTITIAKSTLPPAVVAGTKTKAAITVSITNPNNNPVTENFTVTIDSRQETPSVQNPSGISNPLITLNDTVLATMTKKLTIKANSSLPFTIRLKTLPTSLSGGYALSALLTDGSGDTDRSPDGPTFTAAAPFVSLVPTVPSLVTAKNGNATLSFTLTNTGNVPAAGADTFTLVTAATVDLANAQSVFTQSQSPKISTTKPHTIRLKLTAAQVAALNASPVTALRVTDSTGAVQTLILKPTV